MPLILYKMYSEFKVFIIRGFHKSVELLGIWEKLGDVRIKRETP